MGFPFIRKVQKPYDRVKGLFATHPSMHTGPEWDRFVQKTKKVKVVQIYKNLAILMSFIFGLSNMIIYRAITMTR